MKSANDYMSKDEYLDYHLTKTLVPSLSPCIGVHRWSEVSTKNKEIKNGMYEVVQIRKCRDCNEVRQDEFYALRRWGILK